LIVIQSIYSGKVYRARAIGTGIDFNYVGTQVREKKPYINTCDIDNMLGDINLKDLSLIEKSEFRKILLGSQKETFKFC
jgi:hypothetical protein